MRTLLLLSLIVCGTLFARDKDPWAAEPVEAQISLWQPIAEGPFKGKYADSLMRAAAILNAREGSAPATVIAVYGRQFERLKADGGRFDEAVLRAGKVELERVESPLEQLAGTAHLAFAPLPNACDAFELEVPCTKGSLTVRFRRLSRRIKDAELHLAAWIKHANSDRLRVVSAIQPYLDCDGYRAFSRADDSVRATLMIRELARGEDAELARFLAWQTLLETGWGSVHLTRKAGDDKGVRLALAAWRKRGIAGVPKECPGGSER